MKRKIQYKSGYKYQITRSYSIMLKKLKGSVSSSIISNYISLSSEGLLLIARGYAWDGPSGPTIDTRSFMRGSLVHDALYQLMRNNLLPRSLRKLVDEILYDICIEDGMWKIRALWVYSGVRLKGAPSTYSENVKKTLEAP